MIKSATGTGKTVIVADTVRKMNCVSAVIAHRSELVSQMSVAMAREGVRHRVIGSDATRRTCVAVQMEALGRSYYDPGAKVGICSVDTLVKRDTSHDSWYRNVGFWAIDEGHHIQQTNKWGRGAAMFPPTAYGLAPTATPARADGKGLGRENDGLMDAIVYGPEMSDQIARGYLTGYKIYAPPSDVDYSQVTVTESGDLSPAKLRAAVHASDKIVGDVVMHYREISMAKLGRLGLGVTFAVDVEAAKEICEAFRKDGIPAEVVTDKTPAILRAQIIKRFARREILQLVNVDLFGEGFDLPAIEIVSMVRKTESWPLFVQQFGRVLRLMISEELSERWGSMTDVERLHFISVSAKPYGIVIDHVGNVIRHGLPDAPRVDTLDRRLSRSSTPSDAIPTRVCTNTNANGTGQVCAKSYFRYLPKCPHCKFAPVPLERSAPEFVDGNLWELDEQTLQALRGKVFDISSPPHLPSSLSGIQLAGARNAQNEKINAQVALREAIALWAGLARKWGLSDQESHSLFWLTYKIDVYTAQGLGRAEADALTSRIRTYLDQQGVIAA